MNTFPLQWPWDSVDKRLYQMSKAPTEIPWAMIEPHRRQAMANHSQTLERLAQRGGLSFQEFLAVLADRDVFEREFIRMPHPVAVDRVRLAVAAFEALSSLEVTS